MRNSKLQFCAYRCWYLQRWKHLLKHYNALMWLELKLFLLVKVPVHVKYFNHFSFALRPVNWKASPMRFEGDPLKNKDHIFFYKRKRETRRLLFSRVWMKIFFKYIFSSFSTSLSTLSFFLSLYKFRFSIFSLVHFPPPPSIL